MNRLAAPTAAAALLLAAVLVSAGATGDQTEPDPADDRPPMVIAPLAVVAHPGADDDAASSLRVARRALDWLLAAETGGRRALPEATFTPGLARELNARPPRPLPRGGRARILDMREQAPLGAARRVLAVLRRGGRREPVTLLLVCRPACRVAAVA